MVYVLPRATFISMSCHSASQVTCSVPQMGEKENRNTLLDTQFCIVKDSYILTSSPSHSSLTVSRVAHCTLLLSHTYSQHNTLAAVLAWLSVHHRLAHTNGFFHLWTSIYLMPLSVLTLWLCLSLLTHSHIQSL